MRKYVFTLLLLAVLLPLCDAAPTEFKKTKIAVLDFSFQGSGLDPDMGKIVAEWLTTSFVKDGRFEVIERRLLKSVIDEQKLVMNGVVDTNNAEELGKLLGVKVIITGSILKYQDVLEANARIIDVANASIIAAESVKSSTAVKLEDMVKEMAQKIIADFPLQGYVVSQTADTVTLDLGHTSGVKPGMHFSVFKEGAIIKHPKTGEVLDIERAQTALVEITSVREKISMAKILHITDGAKVEYGQLVTSVKASEEHRPAASKGSSMKVSAPPPRSRSNASKAIAVTGAEGDDLLSRIASDDSSIKVRAIKESWSQKRTEPAVITAIANELKAGYQLKPRDRYHVDAMSWCCTILGNTGDMQYADLLTEVSRYGSNDKLKAYAQKGIALMAKSLR